MRELSLRLIPAVILCSLALSSATQAQSDPAKIFKTNCTLCHGADGSGDNPTGKAFHAKDLRSAEVQKQTDAELAEVIIKGRGKMPAFGAKIKPDDVTKLVAYLRELPKQK
jgi:mono/diheme cytochrome c family protein